MKTKVLRLFLLVLIAGAFVPACAPGGLGIGFKGQPGSLTVTISDKIIKPHTITPSTANYTVGSYSLSFSGPAGETFTALLIPDSSGTVSHTYDNLACGSWTIKVDALNQAGSHDIIGHGEGTGVVSIAAGAFVQIQIKPISGTGTLTITVDFTGTSLADPRIDATLAPESGQTKNVTLGNFTLSGSILTSTSTLDNGYYKLTGRLLDGTTQQGLPITEVVWVIAGQTSSANYVFSGGSLAVSIASNLLSALTVALAQAGTTLTASVTNPNPPPANVLYEWDVDGSLATGETSASYDYSSLPSGAHSITAIVYTAGWAQAGSAVANILVSPAQAPPDFVGTWSGGPITLTLSTTNWTAVYSDSQVTETTTGTLTYDASQHHVLATVASSVRSSGTPQFSQGQNLYMLYSISGNIMTWAVNLPPKTTYPADTSAGSADIIMTLTKQ